LREDVALVIASLDRGDDWACIEGGSSGYTLERSGVRIRTFHGHARTYVDVGGVDVRGVDGFRLKRALRRRLQRRDTARIRATAAKLRVTREPNPRPEDLTKATKPDILTGKVLTGVNS
jgi:hypothetical protein